MILTRVLIKENVSKRNTNPIVKVLVVTLLADGRRVGKFVYTISYRQTYYWKDRV